MGIIVSINSSKKMTFEEILQQKMAEALPVKGKADETIMPIEAMVMAVMAKATKGDIPSIVFINNMVTKPQEETDEERLEKRNAMFAAKAELRKVLEGEGFDNINEIELENLSQQLMTLRRIAEIMGRKNHKDIESQTQKDGTIHLQLSTINRIYGELLKNFRADFAAFRVQLLQHKLQNKK